ncbi:MAG: hypothetical protein HZB65_00270 [Candidatus Aenigmarchaeota archaeon]|nr:hypothetical protein [Candidatus Aenigmarchaeota archaeon]
MTFEESHFVLVMDFLPIILSHACKNIENIKITRAINPLTRRQQFQKKVGIGMTEEEFNQAVSEHKIGHVGLRITPYDCRCIENRYRNNRNI